MITQKFSLSVALATGALAIAFQPSAAWSQTAADMSAIRQMVEQMKQDYESKIRELEQRLEKAEGDATTAKESAAQTKAAVAAQPATAAKASPPAATAAANPNAFNPAISGVLNGTFGAFSRNPDGVRIPGFALGGEASEGNSRGFSLGESEVSLSANIDQALFGQLTLALTGEDEIAVEEAFIQTTSLPYGFSFVGHLLLDVPEFFSGKASIDALYSSYLCLKDPVAILFSCVYQILMVCHGYLISIMSLLFAINSYISYSGSELPSAPAWDILCDTSVKCTLLNLTNQVERSGS